MILTGLILCFGSFGIIARTLPTAAEGQGRTFSAGENHITIFDDGQKIILRSRAGTVGEVLEQTEVLLGEHDNVEPALDTEIESNFIINIYRARPVVIRDGNVRVKVMTSHFDPRIAIMSAGFDFRPHDTIEVRRANILDGGATFEYVIVRGERDGPATISMPDMIELPDLANRPIRVMPVLSSAREGLMRDAGIHEDYFAYVNFIVMRESSWNPNAVNPSSGACGLGQQLPCGKWDHYGPWNDPVAALRAMNSYVMGRYFEGGPLLRGVSCAGIERGWPCAYAFWTVHGWY